MKVIALATAVAAAPSAYTTVGSWPLDPTEFGQVVVVDDAPELNPGDRDFRVSIRMRTDDEPDTPDWDLIRKGYSASDASLFKVELMPGGQALCAYVGTDAKADVQGGPDLSDDQWHTVTCEKTTSALTLIVDGRIVASEDEELGEIANGSDIVVGAHGESGSSELFEGYLADATIEIAR